MSKWVNQKVLDNGLDYIKNNSAAMLLLSSYTAGDSYETVISNKLAEVPVSSADFSITSLGASRVVTISGGKLATALASSDTPDLHIAFTDGESNVIWVLNESTNRTIAQEDIVVFPAAAYKSNQPV